MPETDTTKVNQILQNPALIDYVFSHAQSPHPYLATIRIDCLEHKWSFMLTTPDQAAFLFSQVKILRAKKILELGCYYGHSTLALAAGLEPEGRLISIEHNPKFAKIAQDHLQQSGLGKNVEFIVGEAPACIQDIAKNHAPGSFDLIFIDADKRNVELYWTTGLELVRKGGLIIIDNALARGEIVAHDSDVQGHISAMHAFNENRMRDSKAFSYIASIGDGMHVSVKI